MEYPKYAIIEMGSTDALVIEINKLAQQGWTLDSFSTDSQSFRRHFAVMVKWVDDGKP